MRRNQISSPRVSLLSRRARLTVFALVTTALPLALVAPSTSAPAKNASLTISGKLNRAGYTVLAVGYQGKVSSTSKQSFALRLAEKSVTLQLVTPRGKYAGPIVVGYAKGKAIVGVRAGAKLGLIQVLASKGYARVTKTVNKKWLDSKRVALVKKQVPLGNGRNFGFVRSSRHNGASGNGGDTDFDGVPNILDSAASGSRVLNSLRPDTATAGPALGTLLTPLADVFGTDVGPAPGPGTEPGPGPASEPTSRWMSQIFLDIPHTLNADAAGVTREQIDAMLVENLNTKLLNVATGDSVKLDCHGLSYCSEGGTGQVVLNGAFSSPGVGGPVSVTEPWPACCTAGGDGFGILRGGSTEVVLNGNEFSLDPRADSSKIGTGDLMTMLVTKDGTTTETPVPLDFVFNTVPALQSYGDGVDHSVTISYPATESSPGTRSNPAQVSAGPDGHVKVHFTWWRPQRSGIAGAGEPDFMDIGGLVYAFNAASQPLIPNASSGGSSPACSAVSVSTSDSNLTLLEQPDSSGKPSGGLKDGSVDQVANSANTLSATLDLTQCVLDKGGSAGMPVDSVIHMDISANTQNSSDHANQDLYFRAS
jgi:hypothetical protein